MARYIDADELLKEFEVDTSKKVMDISDLLFGVVREMIEKQPTADVEEVKHGEWIEDGYYDVPCVCSNCGTEAHHTSRFQETFDYDWEENLQSTGYEEIKLYIKTPYCPNCGAKMDGERK